MEGNNVTILVLSIQVKYDRKDKAPVVPFHGITL